MSGPYITEELVINTAGKHWIDSKMGTDFFHDTNRMHHDALMDGAKSACDAIFGPNTIADPTDTDGTDDSYDKWKVIAIIFVVLFGISLSCLIGFIVYVYRSFKFSDSVSNIKPPKVRSTEMSPMAAEAEKKSRV